MKPPKDCSPECAKWFNLTAKSQRDTVMLNKTYPFHGFKDELKIRFRIRLSMLRNPAF
jgi:hypothetical protein